MKHDSQREVDGFWAEVKGAEHCPSENSHLSVSMLHLVEKGQTNILDCVQFAYLKKKVSFW